MKIITHKYFKIYSAIFSLLLLLNSCSKDQPVAPQAGPFEVTHDIPASVPASGGSYNLTIDGTTNGWWIVKSENVTWLTINRVYGSAKVSQQITVSPNTGANAREVTLEIKATNNESKIIKINQAR